MSCRGAAAGASINFAVPGMPAASGGLRILADGSQADITAGRVVLKPIRDSADVDVRRARMGLPPLADYVRLLDSLYTKQRP